MSNINMDNSNFAYTATIKLNGLPKCKTQADFPGIADIAVNSRTFANYFDCSNSVKKFMDSIVGIVNNDMPKDHKYMITIEVNPFYSKVDTKSKNWTLGELARLWMFESAEEESSAIHAVGQARVFALERESVNQQN